MPTGQVKIMNGRKRQSYLNLYAVRPTLARRPPGGIAFHLCPSLQFKVITWCQVRQLLSRLYHALTRMSLAGRSNRPGSTDSRQLDADRQVEDDIDGGGVGGPRPEVQEEALVELLQLA